MLAEGPLRCEAPLRLGAKRPTSERVIIVGEANLEVLGASPTYSCLRDEKGSCLSRPRTIFVDLFSKKVLHDTAKPSVLVLF